MPGPGAAAEALGGDPVLLPNGLYRLELSDGYELTTHGPDPAFDALGTDLASGPERAPVCGSGNVMHVLYAHPALVSTSRLDAVEDSIRAQIRRTNALLNEAALESGGTTADYKVPCDASGEIRIDGFANTTVFPYFTNIVEAARQAGFKDPSVDYLIFYDDDFPGICGFGEHRDDTKPGADNRNNVGGYGVTYEQCWFSRTPMHENGHTQGAVLTGAPDEDGTNHCTDQIDVMCYPSVSSPCPTTLMFDCGYDSYFDAAPEAGEWLATHWNIGSRANRYIAFGDTPAPAAPPPVAAPVPSPQPSPTPTPEPSPSSSEGEGTEGESEPDVEAQDPAAGIGTRTPRPVRDRRFTVDLWLTSCGGHEGTEIQLQRKKAGAFVTIARKALDEDCVVSVRIRARFAQTVFRSLWEQQDEDHHTSVSRTLRIATR
ncbi:MAG: hypothetical protein ACLGIB_11890 [Actinomycetota bacterium]